MHVQPDCLRRIDEAVSLLGAVSYCQYVFDGNNYHKTMEVGEKSG